VSTRILIFAKAPTPGAVKTRLIPALGAQGAAALAQRMLTRMIEAALEANIGPVELCASPAADQPAWRALSLPAIHFSAQGDGDLGARLARHSQRIVANGESVLLVGTDCLQLDAALLRSAATTLAQYDCVIHPTFDGGYALLGLRRFDPCVFADIAWSTATVAASTKQRIAQLGWSLHCAAILHDIDEPADLVHLPLDWRQPHA
jgi:uncharacterized protein